MLPVYPISAIDYLVIGHLTCDITPQGLKIGGTAAFSALTAQALGLRAGIVTSYGNEIPLGELQGIPVINYETEKSTTFKNLITSKGRNQWLYHQAPKLDYFHIPEAWRHATIIHLGPVAQEIEPGIIRNLTPSLLGLTPQGWMRTWNSTGRVTHTDWSEATFVLPRVGAAVISVEDVDFDETRIDEIAANCRILVVTEADEGCRVYWNGDVRRIKPPKIQLVDPTGAGDIFATAFFSRLYTTRDPWEAARFATRIAAYSVERVGFSAIPTQEEIQACLVEIN
jgi:sugar/nucleoside kinase (ribokinase family)